MENAITNSATVLEIIEGMEKTEAFAIVAASATAFSESAKTYSELLHKLALNAIKFGVWFDDPAGCNVAFNSIPLAYRKAFRVYLSEFSPFVWSKDGKEMINRPSPMKTEKAKARLGKAMAISPTDFLKVTAKKTEAEKTYNEIVKSVAKRLASIVSSAGLNARDVAIIEGAIKAIGHNVPEANEPEEKPEAANNVTELTQPAKPVKVKASRKVKAMADIADMLATA